MTRATHIDNGPIRVRLTDDCPHCFATGTYVYSENDTHDFEVCSECGHEEQSEKT